MPTFKDVNLAVRAMAVLNQPRLLVRQEPSKTSHSAQSFQISLNHPA